MPDDKDLKDKQTTDTITQDSTVGSAMEKERNPVQSSVTSSAVDPEVEKLQQDLQDLQAARMQLMADFDNYRKRMDSEKAQFGAIANLQLISQILEILDDVQLAMNDETQSEVNKHVLQIVHDKLIATLNSVGVHKVQTNIGDKYDPATMAAITTIPTDKEELHNTVAQVISSAFRFNQDERMLKTAKVIVYKLSQ